MYITVKLFGTLRRLSQMETPGYWKGEVPEQITIRGLIQLLGTVEAEVAAASINGEAFPFEAEIPDKAVVTLVTPVGGGSEVGGVVCPQSN